MHAGDTHARPVEGADESGNAERRDSKGREVCGLHAGDTHARPYNVPFGKWLQRNTLHLASCRRTQHRKQDGISERMQAQTQTDTHTDTPLIAVPLLVCRGLGGRHGVPHLSPSGRACHEGNAQLLNIFCFNPPLALRQPPAAVLKCRFLGAPNPFPGILRRSTSCTSECRALFVIYAEFRSWI